MNSIDVYAFRSIFWASNRVYLSSLLQEVYKHKTCFFQQTRLLDAQSHLLVLESAFGLQHSRWRSIWLKNHLHQPGLGWRLNPGASTTNMAQILLCPPHLLPPKKRYRHILHERAAVAKEETNNVYQPITFSIHKRMQFLLFDKPNRLNFD